MEDGCEAEAETRRKVLAVGQVMVQRPGVRQAGVAKGGRWEEDSEELSMHQVWDARDDSDQG